MQKWLVLDLDYCMGCRSCAAACQAAFKGEARIKHTEIGSEAFLPFACRHCEEPLCATACPTEAITRDEKTGIVKRSTFLCVGCYSCAYACPFGVIDPALVKHVSQKCDLCEDRAEGPRCAASCPTGALKFLTEKEIKKIEVGRRILSQHPYWRRV